MKKKRKHKYTPLSNRKLNGNNMEMKENNNKNKKTKLGI